MSHKGCSKAKHLFPTALEEMVNPAAAAAAAVVAGAAAVATIPGRPQQQRLIFIFKMHSTIGTSTIPAAS